MSFKRRPERRVRGFGLFQYRSRNGRGQKTPATFFRTGSARSRQIRRYRVLTAANVPSKLRKRPAPIAHNVSSGPYARPGQNLRPSREAANPLQAAMWLLAYNARVRLVEKCNSRRPTGQSCSPGAGLDTPQLRSLGATRSPGAAYEYSRSVFDRAPPRRAPTRRPTGPSVGRF
jgi:hypothetical protein